jgi:hypothetical protein
MAQVMMFMLTVDGGGLGDGEREGEGGTKGSGFSFCVVNRGSRFFLALIPIKFFFFVPGISGQSTRV